MEITIYCQYCDEKTLHKSIYKGWNGHDYVTGWECLQCDRDKTKNNNNRVSGRSPESD